MFFNWTEYNIKESILWSDTNVKQNRILKIEIRFCLKDVFVLKCHNTINMYILK